MRESVFRLARTTEVPGVPPSENFTSPPVLGEVYLIDMTEPSPATPLSVPTNWSPCSRLTAVSSLRGLIGPSNFDLATLSFQVPTKGFAAKSEPAQKNTDNGYNRCLCIAILSL